MTPQELIKLIEATIVIAGIVAVFFAVFKDKTTRAIITQQKDLIDTLSAQVSELRTLHMDNEKAISRLEGQVEVYKELPLSKIAAAMEQITKTQGKILKELEKANGS
jgi:hypothetical protein